MNPILLHARTIAVGLAIPLLVVVGAAPAAHADSSDTTSTVVDTDTVAADDFTEATSSTEDQLSDVVLAQSADMGVMVDESQIAVQKAPGVGYVAGTPASVAGVDSVSRKEAEVADGDTPVAEDVTYGLRTGATDDAADPALPLGPGSLGVKFYDSEPCAFLFGSDTGNWVSACETLGYLDDGDGRHGYGVSDDDGSSKYDWFTYHQWGTVHPSDSGPDWIIESGKKASLITGASIANGDPGVTDYAPNSSSCDGALTMGVDFVFNFSGELCTSGTEIDLPDTHGSFGQHLTIGVVGPDNSKGLNYRVAVRIKQGVKPDWYTINTAEFRKMFSTTTNTIDDIS
ncbi:MAG: hypothetical protein JWP74_1124 [Marmoricola sp.]|nr:hypothetical protein [Marmoricola sp.]